MLPPTFWIPFVAHVHDFFFAEEHAQRSVCIIAFQKDFLLQSFQDCTQRLSGWKWLEGSNEKRGQRTWSTRIETSKASRCRICVGRPSTFHVAAPLHSRSTTDRPTAMSYRHAIHIGYCRSHLGCFVLTSVLINA